MPTNVFVLGNAEKKNVEYEDSLIRRLFDIHIYMDIQYLQYFIIYEKRKKVVAFILYIIGYYLMDLLLNFIDHNNCLCKIKKNHKLWDEG